MFWDKISPKKNSFEFLKKFSSSTVTDVPTVEIDWTFLLGAITIISISENKLLISAKLQNWIDDKIANTLKSLVEEIDPNISSEARAIVYNVFDSLGTMSIYEHSDNLKNLSEGDRSSLSKTELGLELNFFLCHIC